MTETLSWANRHTRKQQPTPVLQPITPAVPGAGYGQRALQLELDALRQTTEGGRNARLNTASFSLHQLVASGHLTETEVHDQLRAVALAIGLTPSETEATIASGRRAGEQQPRQVAPLELVPVDVTEVSASELAGPAAQQPQNGPAGEAEGEGRKRTSWWPLPLAERAAAASEEPAPTHLVRDDGQPLLYSGKVNGLIGESESGKSWVALLAVTQAVAAGQRVLMLDFEDSPGSIHGRLDALGVTDDQLALLDYANPDESLGALQSGDLSEALLEGYALVVVDGVNAAMTLLGYDLNSNTDATLFATKLLRPLARTGACVCTVDHVPKNSEQRGKGGIGAQAKRAMVDGCTLLVDVQEPFGKGQSGVLRLTVDKDRPGHVRGASSGSTYAGRVHLDSVGDQVRLHVSAPDLRPAAERPQWRPTGVMEKVSRLLERLDGTPSYRAIEEAVGGRKDVVKTAVAALVDDGYIKLASGPNRSIQHHLLRPFRESDEPQTPVSPGVPKVSPGDTSAGVPRTPSPYGEGDTQRGHTETPVSPSTDGDTQQPLDLPDGHSSCNRCGDPTADAVLDEHRGYCPSCAGDLGR